MAVVSRSTSVILGILVFATVGFLLSDNSAKPELKKSTAPPKAKTKPTEREGLASELKLAFEKPPRSDRNLFHPLIVAEKSGPKLEAMEITAIPSKLADGESNWTYTGMAEVDGVKLALLENSASKQSGFVKEGELWKKSRLVAISLDSILVAGPDGAAETIVRFNPNAGPKVKAPAEGGFRPYNLSNGFADPIGENLQVRKIDPAPRPVPPKKK